MGWPNEFEMPAIPQNAGDLIPHLKIVGGVLVAYFILTRLFSYISILRQVRGLPTQHAFLAAYELGLRTRAPHIPWLLPVKSYYSVPEFERFDKAGSDLLAYTVATEHRAVYFTANPQTAAHLYTKSSDFGKAAFMRRYRSARKFGSNIIAAADGAEHKQHKAIVRGCFGEAIFQRAWEGMSDIVDLMLKEEGVVDGGILKDATFCLIGQVGFGQEVPWNIPETKPGDPMPFLEAMEVIDQSLLYQFMLPGWLMKLIPTDKFKRFGQSQVDFVRYCYQMVREKRAELGITQEADSKPPTDLLGALVYHQMAAENQARSEKGTGQDQVGLTEGEVFSNMFMFLLAGHETTGHTLAFTLAYLALNPQWQEECYNEIREHCGDEAPAYHHVHKLALCHAAGLEALRMRDIVRILAKAAVRDTTIPYTTWDKEGNVTHRQHPVKAGSIIFTDQGAAQRNPFHWDDPNTYNPRRHLSVTADGDARTGVKNNSKNPPFIAFSLGQRQCIGRRFAEVEMVVFLAKIMSRYTIHPVPLHPGESRESIEHRMLDTGTEDLTLIPGKFSIRLEKRA
ncbi:hypothetical protein I316_04637 [Kwoniella heveanensis BCC8398]|uniref:Cytochrome P450 n=1 Tax=Kwoniella heveanensis BCC8398 TaxID=1296120 RepID=A0A1B9GRU0_9TREE|nr:hypothetical protein I316_04637 [Kwoniella heveanensis BCC8398]